MKRKTGRGAQSEIWTLVRHNGVCDPENRPLMVLIYFTTCVLSHTQKKQTLEKKKNKEWRPQVNHNWNFIDSSDYKVVLYLIITVQTRNRKRRPRTRAEGQRRKLKRLLKQKVWGAGDKGQLGEDMRGKTTAENSGWGRTELKWSKQHNPS